MKRLCLLIAAAGLLLVPAGALGATGLRVRANHLVFGRGRGRVVQLRGVDRSGTEYACIQGWGVYDSPTPMQPDSPQMIRAMLSWDIDAVRVPLNEDCWLGLGVRAPYGGADYRRSIERYVHHLNAAGLFVILDLHWASPVAGGATEQLPMADAAHAPAFWRSVARGFRHDHDLIFDLFNEPYGISWSCWRNGCRISAGTGYPAYRAAGMQRLVRAVRATGATQPLMLGGVDWASDLSKWRAFAPHDPRHQLVAAEHNYGGLSPCGTGCLDAVLAAARRVPVVFGELGETDCATGYIRPMMDFADRHGISYLGWAWDSTASGWSCSNGPALISSYDGAPTAYGTGFRAHFRGLGRPIRP
ncbi:MAG TPA: cellulase family glycosylhydrolase [Solirubrobacteraceae bacterium]|nr:cellulase family glycosylhydrolase [Solirubrobacteraceae bacterium]